MSRSVDVLKKTTFSIAAVTLSALNGVARDGGDAGQGKKLKNGKPVSEANVLDKINTGGGGMPAFADKLSQEDKDNLLAYLHTI